jgi:hypothetical protein
MGGRGFKRAARGVAWVGNKNPAEAGSVSLLGASQATRLFLAISRVVIMIVIVIALQFETE